MRRTATAGTESLEVKGVRPLSYHLSYLFVRDDIGVVSQYDKALHRHCHFGQREKLHTSPGFYACKGIW